MRTFIMYTKDLLLRGGAALGGFLYGLEHSGKSSAVLLLVIMAAEYVSGIAAAALKKSSKSVRGVDADRKSVKKALWRKALIIAAVVMAYALDWFIGKGSSIFSTAAIWFYISNEGLSFIENLVLSGIPVPKQLKRAFEMLKSGEKKQGQDEDSSGELSSS